MNTNSVAETLETIFLTADSVQISWLSETEQFKKTFKTLNLQNLQICILDIYITTLNIVTVGVVSTVLTYRVPSVLTYIYIYNFSYGPGSSVGIATDYGLGGLGTNPGGDEVFRPSRPALGPTQPPIKWVPCLSRM